MTCSHQFGVGWHHIGYKTPLFHRLGPTVILPTLTGIAGVPGARPCAQTAYNPCSCCRVILCSPPSSLQLQRPPKLEITSQRSGFSRMLPILWVLTSVFPPSKPFGNLKTQKRVPTRFLQLGRACGLTNRAVERRQGGFAQQTSSYTAVP